MYLQQLRAEEFGSEGGLLWQAPSKCGPSALVQKDIKARLLLCQGNIHHLLIRAPLCPLRIPPHRLEVRQQMEPLPTHTAAFQQVCVHSHHMHVYVCIPHTCHPQNCIISQLHLSSSDFIFLSPQHPPTQMITPPFFFSWSPGCCLLSFLSLCPHCHHPLLLLLLRLSLLRCLDLRGCVSHTGKLVCLLTAVCLLVIWGDNVWCQQKKKLDEQKPDHQWCSKLKDCPLFKIFGCRYLKTLSQKISFSFVLFFSHLFQTNWLMVNEFGAGKVPGRFL